MFRSFFICFLILSALTSKGAEVQINQTIADIPADMLPELFNAVLFKADSQAGPSLKVCERAFYSNQSENSYAIEKQLEEMRRDSAAVWILPVNDIHSGILQCSNAGIDQEPSCINGICSCASGLSPPDSMKDFMEDEFKISGGIYV